MARKTRRDRDLERASAQSAGFANITVEITFGSIGAVRSLHPDLVFENFPDPAPAGTHVAAIHQRESIPPGPPLGPAPTAHLVLEPPPEPPVRTSTRRTRATPPAAPATPAQREPALANPTPEATPVPAKTAPADEPTKPEDKPASSSDAGRQASPSPGPSSSADGRPRMSSDTNAESRKKPAWEKVLWKEQDYPDNYVSESFLKDLVVNARVPVRRWWPVVLDAAAVSQQLSLATAAGLAPVHLLLGHATAEHLMILSASLLLFGYIICAVLGGHLLGGTMWRGLRQGALLVGGVYFLSPLLKTLAATVSTDSVIALAVSAIIAHLFLHDYGFVNTATDKLSGTMSLAAAGLAAVLVASMMPSELHVFAQVLFALELFLLFPYVRRYLRATSTIAHLTLTLTLAIVTALALAHVSSGGFAIAYLAAHMVLTLVCPWALVSIHKYKAKISGPWDEAVPQIPAALLVEPPATSKTE